MPRKSALADCYLLGEIMEIFGMFIPLWVIVTTYIVGMFVIGYPMGYFSLKVWKYPLGYKHARKILFPVSNQNSKITEIDDASILAEMFQTNKALKYNDEFALMRYLFATMLLWPIRFSYLFSIVFGSLIWKVFIFCFTKIVYPFLLFVGLVANIITTLGAKGLLACKKCSQI